MRGLTAGYLLISLALAILVAFVINRLWYLIPLFLIFAGAYVLGLTARPISAGRESSSARIYTLTWGGIMALFGAFLIVNDSFPGNLVIMVALFLVFIGAIAILAFVMRR
jgi:hypothetical protein